MLYVSLFQLPYLLLRSSSFGCPPHPPHPLSTYTVVYSRQVSPGLFLKRTSTDLICISSGSVVVVMIIIIFFCFFCSLSSSSFIVFSLVSHAARPWVVVFYHIFSTVSRPLQAEVSKYGLTCRFSAYSPRSNTHLLHKPTFSPTIFYTDSPFHKPPLHQPDLTQTPFSTPELLPKPTFGPISFCKPASTLFRQTKLSNKQLYPTPVLSL